VVDAKTLSLPRSARIRNWLTAPEFAGVRDPGPITELPPPELADWLQFWAEARNLLDTFEQKKP
jgi:hypothetical protein